METVPAKFHTNYRGRLNYTCHIDLEVRGSTY